MTAQLRGKWPYGIAALMAVAATLQEPTYTGQIMSAAVGESPSERQICLRGACLPSERQLRDAMAKLCKVTRLHDDPYTRMDETLYYPTFKNPSSVVGLKIAKALRDNPLPASVVMLMLWVIYNIDDADRLIQGIGGAEFLTMRAAVTFGSAGLLFRFLT